MRQSSENQGPLANRVLRAGAHLLAWGLVGAALAFSASLLMPVRYGYRALLEIPFLKNQALIRPSAAKNFLQAYSKSGQIKAGQIRSLSFETDGNQLLDITTYGATLDGAKEVLEECRLALKATFGGPVDHARLARQNYRESVHQAQAEIEATLKDLRQKNRGSGLQGLIDQQRELGLMMELRTISKNLHELETDSAWERGGEFRYVEISPLATTPISPNRTKWMLLGLFLGLAGYVLLRLTQTQLAHFRREGHLLAGDPSLASDFK
jgi:hypothetical protein